ncbi:MAG: hypothetical protein AAGP08_09325 [Pseudomonadota bacterium]
MDVRGLVLIGFSALCLTAAGLFHDQQQRRAMAAGLASASTPLRDCMREGINTTSGRVGCFQPVSAIMGRAFFGGSYGGGHAMSRR